MAYQSWSVVFGEQPSAAKWNILGQNDAAFNNGTALPSANSNSAIVLTSQTTTATSPADLATAGPTVTLTVGSTGIVYVSMAVRTNNGTANNFCYAGVALSSANTVAADASAARYIAVQYTFTSARPTAPLSFLLTGLTPGSTVFTMKYWGESGTKTFSDRILSVIPL